MKRETGPSLIAVEPSRTVTGIVILSPSTFGGPSVMTISSPSSDSEQSLDVLRHSHLFGGLDDAVLRQALPAMRPERHAMHSVALDAQDTDRRFCVLLEGCVKLLATEPGGGRELTVLRLGPGDAFDLVSLLDGQPHRVSAVAVDDVRLLSAPMERVREWIGRHPGFHRMCLPYLGRQMRALTDLATDLALHDTGARLARLILRQVDATSPTHEVPLIDDLSHAELAKMIGTVRVVANRQIQNLKREGIIEARRGHLMVKDLEALVAKCEQFPAVADGSQAGPDG